MSDSKDMNGGSCFELHNYCTVDGEFDYEKYRNIQIEGNKRKINNIWVLENNIKFLSDYIKKTVGSVDFGLCHGTRRGKEQEWFAKYLKCDVLGTEISETATQFPNTIQWDFHDVKPEWIGSVDFIYSNSFDHSYNPEQCLKSWMRCIKPGGVCILEHTSGHTNATKLDPFGAHLFIMPYLILTWGGGAFCVRELLSAPEKKESLQFINYLVIQNIEITADKDVRWHSGFFFKNG